jgi:gas vesicle protein
LYQLQAKNNQQRVKMSRITSFILGVFTGAAIGSVLGILYAPNDGKHTRDKLSYQISRLQDAIKELMERKEALMNDAKSQGMENINNTKREAKKLQAELDKLTRQLKETESKKEPKA